MARYWLLTSIALAMLTACNQVQTTPGTPPSTIIDSFGANPNASPVNVAVAFSWSVTGSGLTCQLDVDNNTTIDYTVQNCTSSSRVLHTYGAPGAYLARLQVTGSDGQTLGSTLPVTITAANQPPRVNVFREAVVAGDLYSLSYSWLVADDNGDIPYCRFDAESDGVWDYEGLCHQGGSGLYSLKHKFTRQGSYKSTLEVSDPYSRESISRQVRVPYNRDPIINTFTAIPGDDKMATVQFAVSDPDGDDLDCTLRVEDVGIFRIPNCKTGTRRYTFQADGSYMVSLIVRDTLGAQVSNSRIVTVGGGGGNNIKEGTMVTLANASCFLAGTGYPDPGKLYCWGRNNYGQLGTGDDDDKDTPQAVNTNLRFKQASGGTEHTCALTVDGEAYCWGYNSEGQLGDDSLTTRKLPTKVKTDLRFTQIVAGDYNACALTAGGDVYCWGNGSQGVLGRGNSDYSNSKLPIQVQAGGVKFTQIDLGNGVGNYEHACGLTAEGKAYCWGNNSYGQVGKPKTTNKFDSPQEVALGYSFKKIVTGGYHTCGLTSATPREVYCWGSNDSGYFGNGTKDSNYLPQQTVGGQHFEQLEAGGPRGYVVCGIKADGETWCWGYNYFGGVGNGSTSGNDETTPQKIATHKFRQIAPARYHSCGYTVDEKLMCWGSNYYYQLGTGNDTNQPSPVYVNPLP